MIHRVRVSLDLFFDSSSFVAVSDHQVARPEDPPSWPSLPTFSSAPEPAEWAAMLMLMGLACRMLLRRARDRV